MVGIFSQWAKILRPLSRTGANLWRRRTTRPYPRRLTTTRIQPGLIFDESDRLKCVACHLCESACPTDCIYVEAAAGADQDREKQPLVVEIDLARCLSCGLCAAACPAQALELVPRNQWGNNLRRDLVNERLVTP